MKKKKIKVFIEGEVLVLDHFSGIGHYTASLLKEVDKLLAEKEFEHFSIEIGLPKKLAYRVDRFQFKNFTYRNIILSNRLINELKRRRMLPPIDLFFGKKTYVFTHFSSWPTLRSAVIPVIYDLSFIHFPQYSAEKNQIFLEKQTKLSAERASRIITISKNSASEISDYYNYDINKIDEVVPVLDTNFFRPQSDTAIKTIRAKHSLFDDFILFVGNIEPRKNLVTLLKAYEQLKPRLQKKYALLLVGAKGWKDSEIHVQINRMRANGLKILQPSSYIEDSDLPALYSAASAFAYVSVYEGYGIPPTEAMACGTPVVSSNNSSLPEAVEDAAIMVDAMNVSDISRALEDVLSSNTLRSKLINKGHERVERLSARESATNFLRAIERCDNSKVVK